MKWISAVSGIRLWVMLAWLVILQSIPARASVAAAKDPLDGVTIEAVETFPNPRASELELGVGLYPFNPYYMGMNINGGYVYHFDNTFAWEIVNASYFFQFQKGLTAELADRYAVSPTRIEKLNYTFSTNFMMNISNGKSILFKNYIRYFRTAFLLGPGLVTTTVASSVAADAGVRFEVFDGDLFAWKLEIRDLLALRGYENYLTFTLGTAIRF